MGHTATPTEEQVTAVALFARHQALKINALAGTGKTSTLELIARSTQNSGLYLAFNRSISREAQQRFPANVQCRTTHSLAFRATPEPFRSIVGKMINSLNPNAVADVLGLPELQVSSGFSLSTRSFGFLVGDTVRRYCYSSDDEIATRHVHIIGRLAALSRGARREVVQQATAQSQLLWRKMTNSTDPTPLGHDGYLKMWALTRPRLETDFIMLDEAQDTNPAVLKVVNEQVGQRIFVGGLVAL